MTGLPAQAPDIMMMILAERVQELPVCFFSSIAQSQPSQSIDAAKSPRATSCKLGGRNGHIALRSVLRSPCVEWSTRMEGAAGQDPVRCRRRCMGPISFTLVASRIDNQLEKQACTSLVLPLGEDAKRR